MFPLAFVGLYPCTLRFVRAAGRALAYAAVLVAITASGARAQEITEAQLKAGYLYNFLLLAEWPEARAAAGASRGYIICVVGGDSVAAAFAPVLNRPVEGYPLRVERYPAQTGPEALRGCHIVALDPGLGDAAGAIVAGLRGLPVLTVGETPGFIDAGGMVGFLVRGAKLRFEINTAAAAAGGIRFRAKILRLAERVVER